MSEYGCLHNTQQANELVIRNFGKSFYSKKKLFILNPNKNGSKNTAFSKMNEGY